MTLKELKRRPIGVLETRSFIVKNKEAQYEEFYYLVKCEKDKYFIGFSKKGDYCSKIVSEGHMVDLVNNLNNSDVEAFEIYIQSPKLSSWMNV